jgi:uncharacterized membrane protein
MAILRFFAGMKMKVMGRIHSAVPDKFNYPCRFHKIILLIICVLLTIRFIMGIIIIWAMI